MAVLRVILNILWLIFGGFWLFLGYMVAGVLLCIPIVTIPWAIASFRVGAYALWPYGRKLVPSGTSGVPSLIGNVIWIIFAGWWLALGHVVSGIALFVTIIGIPLAIADFKLIPVAFMPLGRRIVPSEVGEFNQAWGAQVTP